MHSNKCNIHHILPNFNSPTRISKTKSHSRIRISAHPPLHIPTKAFNLVLPFLVPTNLERTVLNLKIENL